jgi:hypothetical protein
MPITFTRMDSGNTTVEPATVTPSTPAAPPPVVAAAATVSPQAAAAMTQQRDTAGAILVDLFRYLETHAEAHPAVVPAIPVLSSAVAEWRAGTSPDAFAGARRVYQAIQAARRSDPALPDP